jgi:hypothetical protein
LAHKQGKSIKIGSIYLSTKNKEAKLKIATKKIVLFFSQ